MLTEIIVKNLAIVSELRCSFYEGMHVITGETGAGKSIIIDALSLALGDRSSADIVRKDAIQAEINACFDITKHTKAQNLLAQLSIEHTECIIRRVIFKDGRSKAYINGIPVTINQLKPIACELVHIHGQHQNHALLDSEYQRYLLDQYAKHDELLLETKNIYKQWQTIKQSIEELQQSENQQDKLELLNYQLQELQNLDLQDKEFEDLEDKHKQLAKSDELLAICNELEALLETDNLHLALNKLKKIQLNSGVELIEQSIINLDEAKQQLEDFQQNLDLDPESLAELESRLSKIHDLARKLKVGPEYLHSHMIVLQEQHEALANSKQKLQELNSQKHDLELKFTEAAARLSNSRSKAAKELSSKIKDKLHLLEMPNAQFDIILDPLKHNNPTPYGSESINFMVTLNPGQPLAPMKKIASGGEISRISLAIQVISAEKTVTPTLIFDEVDVGISGKTASTVGTLMRALGKFAQVLCITHLPQVAAQGHMHYKVSKSQSKHHTTTEIIPLEGSERVEELARLVGGANITPQAKAHAAELLESV